MTTKNNVLVVCTNLGMQNFTEKISLDVLNSNKPTILDSFINQENGVIYLVVIGFYDSESEILVSKSCFTCLDFISLHTEMCNLDRIGVFEFDNYEDAYETALAIKLSV